MFKLNQQLQIDSHELFEHQDCLLRLHKNAILPWVLIIPKTKVIEFCELPEKTQLRINKAGKVIGRYFIKNHKSEKINFAAIGNVVQQLHVHVVGRSKNDPLWPDVVWGNELPEKKYSSNEFNQIKGDLMVLLETCK